MRSNYLGPDTREKVDQGVDAWDEGESNGGQYHKQSEPQETFPKVTVGGIPDGRVFQRGLDAKAVPWIRRHPLQDERNGAPYTEESDQDKREHNPPRDRPPFSKLTAVSTNVWAAGS